MQSQLKELNFDGSIIFNKNNTGDSFQRFNELLSYMKEDPISKKKMKGKIKKKSEKKNNKLNFLSYFILKKNYQVGLLMKKYLLISQLMQKTIIRKLNIQLFL